MLTLRAARTNRPDEYSWLSPGRGTPGRTRLRRGRPDRHVAQAGHGRHSTQGTVSSDPTAPTATAARIARC
jgi:hypothetical protein